MSCPVTSHHMPHNYYGSCKLYSKCIVKWKSKGNLAQPSNLEVGLDDGSESGVRPSESQDYF